MTTTVGSPTHPLVDCGLESVDLAFQLILDRIGQVPACSRCDGNAAELAGCDIPGDLDAVLAGAGLERQVDGELLCEECRWLAERGL